MGSWCWPSSRWRPDGPTTAPYRPRAGVWKCGSAQTILEAISPSLWLYQPALPDAELDAFVDALAVRIASFDKQAIAETKNFVNVASLPPDAEIAAEWDACLASIQRPASQTRINKLMERGFHKPGDVENRLGFHVGQLGSTALSI